MKLDRTARRRVRIGCIVVGALGGAILPLVTPGGATSPAFTDIEARIGFGAFAIVVNAIFGAVLGWGIAAIALWALRDRDGPSSPERSNRPPDRR